VEQLSQSEGELDDNPMFNSFVDTMSQQLLSKDILYEPMCQMRGKYEKWLNENVGTISADEYVRYQQQFGFVKAICETLEIDESNSEKINDLVQKMEACGNPPPEISESAIPEDMPIGPDGMPELPPEVLSMLEKSMANGDVDPEKLLKGGPNGEECNIM